MPSIKKNIFYQSLYQILTVLLPLILAPYLSRVLGAEGIGIYNYTYSITLYFGFFAMLGIMNHGQRTIAAVRNDKAKLNQAFSDLFFIHLAVSIIVFASFAVYILFFAREMTVYLLLWSPFVLAAIMDITWLFTGIERFELVFTRNIVIRLIMVAGIFLFVKNEDDVWKYILIWAAGSFASQGVVWFFRKRFVTFVNPSLKGIKSHIKPLLLLFVPVVAVSVYNGMDKIILGAMTDNIQVGFFASAEKVILIPMSFLTAFNGVMIPRMSNLNANCNETEKSRLTAISMKYVMILAFALTFGISAIAKDFAPLFFGWEFVECGELIIGLCVIIPVYAFQNVITAQYLIPSGRDKIYSASHVAGAAVSIIANIILIPKYQAMGAVISFAFCHITICAIEMAAARKALPIRKYVKSSSFPLLTGSAMFFAVRHIGGLMGQSVLSVLVQIGGGMVFYSGICAVYLFATKDKFFIANVNRVFRAFMVLKSRKKGFSKHGSNHK